MIALGYRSGRHAEINNFPAIIGVKMQITADQELRGMQTTAVQEYCRDIALHGHATGRMNIYIFNEYTRGGSRVRTINNPFEFTES